jgi:3-phenylpropionate/trans-cinnamate dioxygenase ferredoxin subunit
MADFVKVATVDEIPQGGYKAFELNEDRFIVASTADGFFAFEDQCTHDGEPFDEGDLEDNEIVCPRHGARFDITSGEVAAPPALVGLDTYEVKVEGQDIYIKLEQG